MTLAPVTGLVAQEVITPLTGNPTARKFYRQHMAEKKISHGRHPGSAHF